MTNAKNTKAHTLKLNDGCIFPDLNKSKGHDSNYVTTELEIGVLKYGHIRQMQQIKLEDHMTFAMKALVGLSEKDLDELSSNDAAELIKIVYENLKNHMELTKNFLSTDFGQSLIANMAKLQEESSKL